MVTRRSLLAALAAWPLAALGQGTKPARIGWLWIGEPARADWILGPLRQGLRELGYLEGQHYVLETRMAEGKVERLPALAAELAQLKVDLIVASGAQAVAAARQSTKTIPVVMATGGTNPVASGFVSSLARPGGNTTGVSNMASDFSGKLIELLAAVRPGLTSVAVLVNPANAGLRADLKSIQAAAAESGIKAMAFEAGSPADIERAFAAMSKEKAQALIVAVDGLFIHQRAQIAELAIQHRLPAVSGNREFAEAGGLMSYGLNFQDGFRRAASFVDKILKGAKPGELPVEQPTKFEFVVNRKTAGLLKVSVPQALLLRADGAID
jgi:putative tryptophan/tyrosine transport system substrate-binding protein